MPGATTKYEIPFSITNDVGSTIDNTSQAAAERVEALIDSLIWQPGDLKPTARATASAGWLLCQGQVVLRADYPALFAAIGTIYNIGGETSLQFRLPPGNGRGMIGAGTAAGDPTATAKTLGQRVGAEKHKLTAAESGNKGSAVTVTDPGHGHPLLTHGSGGVVNGILNQNVQAVGGGMPGYVVPAVTGITAALPAADASNEHNNLPPSFVGNWLIKT